MLNNTSLTEMNLASMTLIEGVFPTWVIIVFVEIANSLSAVASMWIIYKNNEFHHSTFILLFALFLNDFVMACYEYALLIWHFYSYFVKHSEVVSLNTCLPIMFGILMISFNNFVFSTSISIDRMISLIWPLQYVNIERRWYFYVVLASIFYSCSMTIPLFWDNFSSPYVLYCSVRTSLGSLYQYLVWCVAFFFYTITISIYVTVLVLIKCGFSLFGEITDTPMTDLEIKRHKLMKNVTKVLVFCSLIFFFKSLNDFVTVAFKIVLLPESAVVIGSYMNFMIYCTSLIYFISFMCFVKDYRNAFFKLVHLKMGHNQIQPMEMVAPAVVDH